MLRLQSWRLHHRSSRILSEILSFPRTRLGSVSSTDKCPRYLATLQPSKEISLSRDKRPQAARAGTKDHGVVSGQPPTRNIPEPWINLDSLSESLQAHQRANHEGIARDGIPLKTFRHRKRQHARGDSSQQQRPWVGTKVLHLSGNTTFTHNISYKGSCPPLLSEWRPNGSLIPRLQFPWLARVGIEDSACTGGSAMERLSLEIKGCEEYFSPSTSESRAAHHVIHDVKQVILDCLDTPVSVSLIGSRAAGTEGPLSDVDLNLRWLGNMQASDCSALMGDQLRKINRQIRKRCFAHVILPHAFVGKASVPIVVGTHVSTGIEFQIQSTISAYDSLEVSRAFIAEYPDVRTLFKILKQMLLMRGLNSGAMGGLTSYPLLNMIVASIKLASSRLINSDSASQLLAFLEFWSDFDFEKNKIILTSGNADSPGEPHKSKAVDPISTIPRVVPKSHSSPLHDVMLSLEDPADVSNDLGRNLHEIKLVQACFTKALESIRQEMRVWNHASEDPSRAEGRASILGWCLGGDYTSFEEARWQLQRFSEQPPVD